VDRLGVYFTGELVGNVSVDDSGRFSFAYDQGWTSRRDSFAISQSLPLDVAVSPEGAGHAFFANLLPEGRVRQLVARHLGLTESNDFSLLDALGGECAGALVISRGPPAPQQQTYRALDEAEVGGLASRGLAFAETSGTGGIRLSLAGAQDKLAVKVEGDQLFLPEGASPSTHILKFANRDYKHLPENELFVTRLAALCELPTVTAELRLIGKRRHLLVKRYDRIPDASGGIRRLHQEDLCQALGVPPGRKYEEEGGPHFDQCFAVVDEASVEPALDTRALIRWLVFNLIVGNADGHAKNLSLLRGEAGAVRLAPFYDLLSTAVYPRVAVRMAMAAGGKSDPGQVAKKDWRALAKAIGVGSFVEDTVRELAEVLPERALTVGAELRDEYGRLPVTDLVAGVIRKRARRSLRLLKP
jgi:serine/threonine-protein kinase HipA